MRLQLIATMLLLASTARAQSTATSRVDVYSDEWITVISPVTAADVEVTPEARIEAQYGVDILSGATQVLSVDAISSATRFEEVRHEAHLGATVQLDPTLTAAVRATVSTEPDYLTQAVSVSFAAELLDRMATLDVSYSLSGEDVGIATDPRFGEATWGHQLQLGWTHILSRTTVLGAVLSGMLHTCGAQIGCQASPYRYVVAQGAGGVRRALRERHPDLRARGAAGLQLSQDLGAGFALHAAYRLYGDSWAVLGHTASLAAAVGLWDERIVLRADGRFSWQGAASFQRDTYETTPDRIPEWRTADRELGALWSVVAGGRVEAALLAVGPFLRLGLSARLAHGWYRYPDATLSERNSWLVGGGVHAEF